MKANQFNYFGGKYVKLISSYYERRNDYKENY